MRLRWFPAQHPDLFLGLVLLLRVLFRLLDDAVLGHAPDQLASDYRCRIVRVWVDYDRSIRLLLPLLIICQNYGWHGVLLVAAAGASRIITFIVIIIPRCSWLLNPPSAASARVVRILIIIVVIIPRCPWLLAAPSAASARVMQL